MKKALFVVTILMFSLLPLAAQTITLVSPNGVENWTIGNTATIVWNSTGVASVRIVLFKGGTELANRIGFIAEGVSAAAGSFPWPVGSYIGGTVTAGNDYYIRVRSESDSTDDTSAAPFTISSPPPPSFTLFLPNGNESWEKGSNKSISWMATNMTVNCRLLLLKDGQVLGTIKDPQSPGGPGGSAIPWKVGDYVGGSANAGSGYKVRIQSVDGQYSDTSDNPFTIAPLPLVIHYNPILKPDYRVLAKLLPDLVVCAEWTSKRPQLGDKRTVTVKVKNIGPGAAPAANFDFYVEGHGTANIPLPALAKNAEYSYAHKFWWNSWGHKTVRITIDPMKQVTEANENNNQVSGSIEVILMRDAYGGLTSRCSDQN